LEEFSDNRDLIGPGHGTADDIRGPDSDAIRCPRLGDQLGRDRCHRREVHNCGPQLGVRLGQGNRHPSRAPTHIHEGTGRGEVIARRDFLRRRHRRHVDAPQKRFEGLGGRLGKIEMRLGNARLERRSGMELERPLSREVAVQRP